MARVAGEAGVTLAELVVAMAVFSVLLALVGLVLPRLFRDAQQAAAGTEATTSAALALAHVDRQVRSAVEVYPPGSEPAPCTGVTSTAGAAGGSCLRVLTLAGGSPRCVQFRLSGGQLESRAWSAPGPPSPVPSWVVLARGLTNTTAEPLFTQPVAGGPVTVRVLTRVSGGAGSTDLQTVVTPRNTPGGTPCAIL